MSEIDDSDKPTPRQAAGGIDPDPPDPGAVAKPLDVAATRALLLELREAYEKGVEMDQGRTLDVADALCGEVDRLRLEALAWKELAQASAAFIDRDKMNDERNCGMSDAKDFDAATSALHAMGIDPETP